MARTLDKPSLYDTDFVAWLEEQAAHLRAGRLAALDIENVAEELEGLARSDRHELANRLETLILDLLKWDHQPDQRSNRWRSTVAEQRRRIRRLLNESPSLRPSLEGMAHEVYPEAVEQAAIDTGLARPHSHRTYLTSSSSSSSASCRRASCPTNDRPEPSTPERRNHDRASDPHRPPAPE
jgi:hypothetical protein